MRRPSFFEALRVIWIACKSGFVTAYGVLRLRYLKQPIITVFGGSEAYEEGKYAKLAREFSKKCALEGASLITGGGPGIMNAVNMGAYEVGGAKQTLGIRVRGVDESFKNKDIPAVTTDYFFSRKWLLIRYASAYVLFPGGIGTLDEFFEVLNLIKLQKIPSAPIILFGVSYWQSVIDWYKHAFEYEFISLPVNKAFIVTDDIDEAIKILKENCFKK